MYITLGFTSIKGLSTDIAYGFNQFNPDRANSAFISNSTPRVSAPPLRTFLLFLTEDGFEVYGLGCTVCPG